MNIMVDAMEGLIGALLPDLQGTATTVTSSPLVTSITGAGTITALPTTGDVILSAPFSAPLQYFARRSSVVATTLTVPFFSAVITGLTFPLVEADPHGDADANNGFALGSTATGDGLFFYYLVHAHVQLQAPGFTNQVGFDFFDPIPNQTYNFGEYIDKGNTFVAGIVSIDLSNIIAVNVPSNVSLRITSNNNSGESATTTGDPTENFLEIYKLAEVRLF